MKNFLKILIALLLCQMLNSLDMAKGLSADCVRDTQLQPMCAILQQSASCGVILNEAPSPAVGVKVNKTTHHQHYFFATRIGDSHSLNLSVAIRNASIICFARSVDKYIYALRHIII